MGNDGGTIARGQDLRAVYGNNATASNNQKHIDNLQLSLLSVCSLTSLPLYEHGQAHAVVSDWQGQLFLKEKLLEWIIRQKSKLLAGPAPSHKLAHINGLGDFLDVHITWSAEGTVMCPVTKTTKTPKSTFAYLRPCGCVVSSRLLGDLRNHRRITETEPDAGVSETCPKCSTPFTFNYDVVLLNPEMDADHAEFNHRNYTHLVQQLHLGHAKKAIKKEKRRGTKLGKKKPEDGKVHKS